MGLLINNCLCESNYVFDLKQWNATIALQLRFPQFNVKCAFLIKTVFFVLHIVDKHPTYSWSHLLGNSEIIIESFNYQHFHPNPLLHDVQVVCQRMPIIHHRLHFRSKVHRVRPMLDIHPS